MILSKLVSLLMIPVIALSVSECSFGGGNSNFSADTANYDDVPIVTIKYSPEFDSGEAKVRWGDRLFDHDPKKFNLELAKTSAALCAAANDRDGRIGHGDYIATALKTLGLEDIWLYSYPKYYGKKAVRKTNLDIDVGTAFALGHKKIKDKSGKTFELIVVVCRGTEGKMEAFINDFLGANLFTKTDWLGIKTYYGFYFFAEEIRKGMVEYVNTLGGKMESTAKFLICGHSLGGAAAQLIATSLQDGKKIAFCYTFGALNAAQEPKPNYGIWNIYNYYDTFGPNGDAIFKPAAALTTYENKYGHVLVFPREYNYIFKGSSGYKTHVMPGYYRALADNYIDKYGKSTLCDKNGLYNIKGKWKSQNIVKGSMPDRTLEFFDKGKCKMDGEDCSYSIKRKNDAEFELTLTSPSKITAHYTASIVDRSHFILNIYSDDKSGQKLMNRIG